MILEVKNISKHFNGIFALKDISFSVSKGEIIGITGENGAGKTTLFNLLTGFVLPENGEIYFKTHMINAMNPIMRTQLGMGRCFQHPRIFPNLKVSDNMLAAAKNHPGEQLKNYLFLKYNRIIQVEKENIERAMQWLKFCNLEDKSETYALNLSFGQKKMLSLAMLLMNNAELLLLDEIYSGINPETIDRIDELLLKMAANGKTLVLIEHKASRINKICNRTITMHQGRIINNHN